MICRVQADVLRSVRSAALAFAYGICRCRLEDSLMETSKTVQPECTSPAMGEKLRRLMWTRGHPFDVGCTCSKDGRPIRPRRSRKKADSDAQWTPCEACLNVEEVRHGMQCTACQQILNLWWTLLMICAKRRSYPLKCTEPETGLLVERYANGENVVYCGGARCAHPQKKHCHECCKARVKVLMHGSRCEFCQFLLLNGWLKDQFSQAAEE